MQKKTPQKYLIPAALLGALFLTSLYSYLLFHTLAELFSIVIGCMIFILAWNFRRFYSDSFLIFIGTAYLFTSAIDLVHALAYKGMGIFQGYDANLPTQLWIAARFMQSTALLAAPLFLRRKVRIGWLLTGFSLVTAAVLLSLFVWNIFPVCYVEGVGLTTFKITSEYGINLILAAAILVMLVHRRQQHSGHWLKVHHHPARRSEWSFRLTRFGGRVPACLGYQPGWFVRGVMGRRPVLLDIQRLKNSS